MNNKKERMWIRATFDSERGIICTDDTEFMLHYERVEKRRFESLMRDFEEVEGKGMIMYVDVPSNIIPKRFASWYWTMKKNGHFIKYRLD